MQHLRQTIHPSRLQKHLIVSMTLLLAGLIFGLSGALAQKPVVSQPGLQPAIFEVNEQTASVQSLNQQAGTNRTGRVSGFSSTGAPKSFTIQETYHQSARKTPPDDRATQGVVGLDLLVQTDAYPKVQGVFPGTPAQKQGIHSGDVLVAVNGQSTLHQDLSALDAMISDVPGDVVALTIRRGSQLKQVSLTVVSLADLSRELQASFAVVGPTP